MKMKFNIDEKFRFDRNHYPERYPFQVLLSGLVTNKAWCPQVLAAVREAAEEMTGGVYGLFVTRDADTGARTGYRFGANDPAVVRQINHAFKQAVRRAGGTTP